MEGIIIIDDNEINNYVCKTLIKNVDNNVRVTCFTKSTEALSDLSSKELNPKTTILLDLDIPEMDGWEFLKLFSKKKPKCNIFILSSSQNPADVETANNNPYVSGFFSKPLTIETINSVLNNTYSNQ